MDGYGQHNPDIRDVQLPRLVRSVDEWAVNAHRLPGTAGRHQNPVLGEEHVARRRAEKSMPPGQQADPDNGQMRRATAIAECMRARRPLRLNELHRADLGINGTSGADLHDSQETNRQRGIDWHHNASTLNGYLIARHIQPPDGEVDGLQRVLESADSDCSRPAREETHY